MPTVSSIATIAYPNGVTTQEQGGSWGSHISFARPANTAAYAAGSVISDSAGTAAVLYFPTTGLNGQLLSAHVISEDVTFAAANLELYVFDSAPPDHVDTAALAIASASCPYLVHRFSFPSAASAVLGAANVRYWEMDGASRFQQARTYACSTVGLYGLLVTRSIVAAATSGAKFHVRLSLQSW